MDMDAREKTDQIGSFFTSFLARRNERGERRQDGLSSRSVLVLLSGSADSDLL